METNELLVQIKKDIEEIKKNISPKASLVQVSDKWVSRADVMAFLKYGDTQMAALEKSGDIVVTKVGKRKFVHRESIAKLLDNNIIK